MSDRGLIVQNLNTPKDLYGKKIMSAQLHKFPNKNENMRMQSMNLKNNQVPNEAYHKSKSLRAHEKQVSCNEQQPSDDITLRNNDPFGPRKSSPVREHPSDNNLQVDANYQLSSMFIKNEIQRKRQRNLEKYANNTLLNNRNDHCSSTHTALSAGKFTGTIQAAGVADFIESGSNYGKFNMGKDSTFKRYPKGNRPWRKPANTHQKKISEIVDDTSVLTKSFTALQSKVNNQKVLLNKEEFPENKATIDAIYDQGNPILQKIEETELLEGDGENISSEAEESAPDESSGGDPAMQLSKSQDYLSGMTYLVQQCKLKRHRFTYMGKEAHSMANYGGKAMAPKALRSQIADINNRHTQQDEVNSERSQSSEIMPNQVSKPIKFTSTNTIKLIKSQCRLSKPTISGLAGNGQGSLAVSPRKDISPNNSKEDIQSIHSNDNEEEDYIEQTKNNHQVLPRSKQTVKEARPSEETLFLSSQDQSSHQNSQVNGHLQLRRNSLTRLSNKGLQTSVEFWIQNQNDRNPVILTPAQPQLNTILENATEISNLRNQKSVRRNVWPTTMTHTYETKSNIAQCEVLPNSLELDQCKYINSQKQRKVTEQSEQHFSYVENFMKTTQIQCFKYNSSLDTVGGQKQSAFSAFISLSNDGKSLIITNKKRKNKVITLDDTLSNSINTSDGEANDNNVRDKSETAINNPDDLQPQYIFREIEKQQQKEDQMQDLLNRQEDRKLAQSSASCDISEIKSFIYGGFSSRFWMLRKHVNSLSKSELDELPFHSWNCITLQLGRRDVDLVIKNDNDMQIFLSFLVYSLCTLDGTRNSAKNLLNSLIDEELQQIKQQTNRNWIRQTHENKVIDLFKTKLFKQIAFKYKIMKIRAKISYMALKRGITIQELFLHAIYKTYVHYVDHYKLDHRLNYIQCDLLYKNIISFEKNLKMIAQDHRDLDQANQQVVSSYSGLTYTPQNVTEQYVGLNATSEQQKIENYINFKKRLKNHAHLIIEGGLKNPYRKCQRKAQNPELYTKEQIKNRKKRNAQKKKSTSRPSADQIKEILRKDKCMEIFKDIMVDQAESLFSNQNIASFVAIKFKKKINQIRFAQLNIFIQLRLISGPRYIEALLARIRLSKEMFLIDLQQGNQVIIPYDLSQDHYPQSYQYYDSILQLIQENMSQDRRDFQKVKQKIGKLFDSKLSLKETLGIATLLNKFKSKKNAIQLRSNSEKRDDIDYNKSQHTRQLQRSQYLLLDDNRKDNSDDEDHYQNFERHTRTMRQILGVKIFKDSQDLDENQNEDAQSQDENGLDHQQQSKKNLIALKYVKPDEVLKQQQNATSIKFMFSNRLNTLKQKGYFLEQIESINNWINENIDHLYQKERSRRFKLNPNHYSGMSKEREEKELLKYRRFLQECAEHLVLDHRSSIRNRKHKEFYSQIQQEKVEYKKIIMLEDLIEQNILYFNAKAGDANHMQIQSIKTILRQKEKARLKKQKCSSHARSQTYSRSQSNNFRAAENQSSVLSPQHLARPQLLNSSRLSKNFASSRN